MNKHFIKYKSLLNKDISEKNLTESIKLFINVLNDFLKDLKNKTEVNFIKEVKITSNILSNKKDHSSGINFIFNLLPEKIKDYSDKNENYNFIIDILLLILNNYLLLNSQYLNSKKNYKDVEVLKKFIENYINDLSIKCYYLGILFEVTGNKNKSNEYFEQSLLLSHTDNHEFMTILQSYWGRLIENKEYFSALNLLLKFYKLSPIQYIEELNDIIRDTFEIMSQDLNYRKVS